MRDTWDKKYDANYRIRADLLLYWDIQGVSSCIHVPSRNHPSRNHPHWWLFSLPCTPYFCTLETSYIVRTLYSDSIYPVWALGIVSTVCCHKKEFLRTKYTESWSDRKLVTTKSKRHKKQRSMPKEKRRERRESGCEQHHQQPFLSHILYISIMEPYDPRFVETPHSRRHQ